MEAAFLKLVNMSITASYLVAAVLVLRLLLKKAPKSIHCVLWAMVALRLMLPFSLESMFSLIPNEEPLPQEFLYAATPQLDTGISSVNNALNPVIAESLAPAQLTSANPTQIYSFIFSQVWILGMVIMGLYAIISYFAVRRKVRASIRVDKTIRLCDHIGSPFILGIIRPKIYLPSDLDPMTAAHVLAHEQAHLKRRDHWWKPLGFALLTVYWFNPVMWLAYILLCRDIEQACDEKVVKELGIDGKKAYSQALLSCSVPRRMITACPLAFGEVGVKGRVKSVLNYKKPAFWIIAVAIIACIVTAVCFLTDPTDENTPYEITSDLWIYDVEDAEVIVWNDRNAHGVYLTSAQIEDVAEIIHYLDEDEFVRHKLSHHEVYLELECAEYTIEVHWDGEYAGFTFNTPLTSATDNSPRWAVKNEKLNAFLAEVAQTEYRLKEGTYVPIDAASSDGSTPDILSLAKTVRYDVTGDGFTVRDLETGDEISYVFSWMWEGCKEAHENLAAFIRLNNAYELGDIRIGMEDEDLKYQHLYDNCHVILQDGTLYLIDGVTNREDGITNWSVYILEEDDPYIVPPETYTEFFKNAGGYVNYELAGIRSGDQRPGNFELTAGELDTVCEILKQMPSDAVRPGGAIGDYYITLSLSHLISYDLRCSAVFYYCDDEIMMYWSSSVSDTSECYQIEYEPLREFLLGLMQPERIDTDRYRVLIDIENPSYVSYTHEDIHIALIKVIGWEYEIVPYTDEHTDFGIRAKPEWLDDWLFFGYMQGELVPDSTFLHEAYVEAGPNDPEQHYLFESPIDDNVLWREWPEVWKMIYCHHDGGTYYIYNEGEFDERLAEHDRGGYQYMEKSFWFALEDEDSIITQSKNSIYLSDYENPEVSYDAESNSYDVLWHKKDSDGYIIVNVSVFGTKNVTKVLGTSTK